MRLWQETTVTIVTQCLELRHRFPDQPNLDERDLPPHSHREHVQAFWRPVEQPREPSPPKFIKNRAGNALIYAVPPRKGTGRMRTVSLTGKRW